MKFKQWGVVLWLPLILSSAPVTAVPDAPIVLPPPPGVNVSATNSQVYRDSAGVIFAATRADSAIGGVVWRVDGYVDPEHPGTATYVLNSPFEPHPTEFFANGELELWPDGGLYYTTVTIASLDNRTTLSLVTYPVPGWTR